VDAFFALLEVFITGETSGMHLHCSTKRRLANYTNRKVIVATGAGTGTVGEDAGMRTTKGEMENETVCFSGTR
jgi:hypothetical protein